MPPKPSSVASRHFELPVRPRPTRCSVPDSSTAVFVIRGFSLRLLVVLSVCFVFISNKALCSLRSHPSLHDDKPFRLLPDSSHLRAVLQGGVNSAGAWKQTASLATCQSLLILCLGSSASSPGRLLPVPCSHTPISTPSSKGALAFGPSQNAEYVVTSRIVQGPAVWRIRVPFLGHFVLPGVNKWLS